MEKFINRVDGFDVRMVDSIDSRIVFVNEIISLNDVSKGEYIICRKNALITRTPFNLAIGYQKRPHINGEFYTSIPLLDAQNSPIESVILSYILEDEDKDEDDDSFVMVRKDDNHFLYYISENDDEIIPSIYQTTSLKKLKEELNEEYEEFKKRIEKIKSDYAAILTLPFSLPNE